MGIPARQLSGAALGHIHQVEPSHHAAGAFLRFPLSVAVKPCGQFQIFADGQKRRHRRFLR